MVLVETTILEAPGNEFLMATEELNSKPSVVCVGTTVFVVAVVVSSDGLPLPNARLLGDTDVSEDVDDDVRLAGEDDV